MPSDDRHDRPCLQGENICQDCDGTPAGCSKNICKDLGINLPDIPPDKLLEDEEYQKIAEFGYELARQTIWIQRQYGHTSKSDIVQDIAEVLFSNVRRPMLMRLLEESAWQLSHMQLVIARMSEDYADLTLVANEMGKALERISDSSNALEEWRAFSSWLYTDPDDDEEIYDQDNEEEA